MNPHAEGEKPWIEGAIPASRVPLERMGSEDDMAGTVVWLCSLAGGYINGNVLVTDGGRLGMMPGVY